MIISIEPERHLGYFLSYLTVSQQLGSKHLSSRFLSSESESLCLTDLSLFNVKNSPILICTPSFPSEREISMDFLFPLCWWPSGGMNQRQAGHLVQATSEQWLEGTRKRTQLLLHFGNNPRCFQWTGMGAITLSWKNGSEQPRRKVQHKRCGYHRTEPGLCSQREMDLCLYFTTHFSV